MKPTDALLPPPIKVLLLGLGNDILTDDAIGLYITRAAKECLANYENVTVGESLEMGLSLLDLIIGFYVLILVDSIQTKQAPPGFLHQFDAGELAVLPNRAPHFLGIGEVIALGRKLGLRVPACVRILAVEVEDPFTVSQQMSGALEAKLPELVRRVVKETKIWRCLAYPCWQLGVQASASSQSSERI